MARGGHGRGSGLPLRERIRPDGTTAATAAQPPAPRPPLQSRHCWITQPIDGGPRRPGLLIEWRHEDRNWFGRVVYTAELRPGEWCVVEEWLPAAALAAA